MRSSLSGIIGIALAAPAFGAIINGDFEAGNTGFTNDYAYRVVSDPPYAGQYGVTTSAFAWSQFWNTIAGDHTSGHGLFLIVDTGGSTANAVWRQTVAVTPNTDYNFSAWLATWTTYPAATVQVAIDGAPLAQWQAPAGAAWAPYSAAWNSGAATSVTITLAPTTIFQPGDDFAVDDISLTPVPAPGAAAVLALGALAGTRRRRNP